VYRQIAGVNRKPTGGEQSVIEKVRARAMTAHYKHRTFCPLGNVLGVQN